MEPAEVSGKSPTVGEPCPVCRGEGSLQWLQAMPDGTMRDSEIPCPHGCGGTWTHPHAERGRVVEERDDAPARVRDGEVHSDEVIPLEMLRDAMTRWGHPPEERGE